MSGWIEDLAAEMVDIARSITLEGGVLVDVAHEPWIGLTGSPHGVPEYGAVSVIPALVDHGMKNVVDANGQLLPIKARVYFLEPIEPYSTAHPWVTERKEPIDPRDRITLPDGQNSILDVAGRPQGSQDRIVNVLGMLMRTTNRPPMFEIWVGEGVNR